MVKVIKEVLETMEDTARAAESYNPPYMRAIAAGFKMLDERISALETGGGETTPKQLAGETEKHWLKRTVEQASDEAYWRD